MSKELLTEKRYIMREGDIIFTSDVEQAMKESHRRACLPLLVLTGEVTFSIQGSGSRHMLTTASSSLQVIPSPA